MKGVVIQHGCDGKLFLSEETLKNCCAVLCPKCRCMISLSLFGSSVKKQLLAHCEELSEEDIAKRIGR